MAEVIPTRKEWHQPVYQHDGPNKAYFKGMERLGEQLDALIGLGRVARFPRGDGYAFYHVTSLNPLQLEHIPAGDAYTADPALLKGLEVHDLPRYGVTAQITTGTKLSKRARWIPGARTITREQLDSVPKALEYTVSGCVDVKTREGTWRYAFTAQMLVKGLLVHRYTITSPLVVSEVSKDKLRNAIAEAIGVQRRFVKW